MKGVKNEGWIRYKTLMANSNKIDTIYSTGYDSYSEDNVEFLENDYEINNPLEKWYFRKPTNTEKFMREDYSPYTNDDNYKHDNLNGPCKCGAWHGKKR